MNVVISQNYSPTSQKRILLFGSLFLLFFGMIATVILTQKKQNFMSKAALNLSQLFLATSTRTVSVGDNIIVNVYLNPKGNPVVGVDTVVKFDPAFVQVTGIKPSLDKGFPTFLPIDQLTRAFSWEKAVSENTGEIRFSALTYNTWTRLQVAPVSSDKVIILAVINMRSIRPGQSRLFLYQTSLSDKNDSNVTMEKDTGPVDVMGPSVSDFLITASGPPLVPSAVKATEKLEVLTARVVTGQNNTYQLIVEVKSSLAPSARISVFDFGVLEFVADEGIYRRIFYRSKIPDRITIISSGGAIIETVVAR